MLPGPAPTRTYTRVVSRGALERRLAEAGDQLRHLRAELAIAEEQCAAFEDEAEDSRLRALVSETPLAQQEHREARRHADAMARHRADVAGEIAALEAAVDDLLDRLTTAT